MSPDSIDCPIESTLIEITHSFPLASLSSPARSSPSRTSTIEETETGVETKVDASRDSRTYMRARSFSVTIPTSAPSSSTIGTWLMFSFAIIRPTFRKGSFLRAVVTSFITSLTRSMMCLRSFGSTAPLFSSAHRVWVFTSPSRAGA
jgi:hypothetical protein